MSLGASAAASFSGSNELVWVEVEQGESVELLIDMDARTNAKLDVAQRFCVALVWLDVEINACCASSLQHLARNNATTHDTSSPAFTTGTFLGSY